MTPCLAHHAGAAASELHCDVHSSQVSTCFVQDMSEATEAPLEPDTPPAAPPGPPEPTPEAIAEEEAEDSDGADWDAMDLDEITLPGQKSAKELAAEKVPCTAPSDATAACIL